MKKLITIILLAVALLPQANYAQTQGTRSAYNPYNVYQNQKTGEKQEFFTKSYALIIANEEYQILDNLQYPVSDAQRLHDVLKNECGFDEVIVKQNLISSEMKKVVEEFIREFASDENNRVLIFYTGHGEKTTVYDGATEEGFTLPVDCPNPEINKKEFLAKAINYSQWELWAKNMQCRHALFAFDCCFGGMIFEESSKSVSQLHEPLPVKIDKAAISFIRFFITAGHQRQTVPDKSLFCDYFIRAITGEDPAADYDPASKGYLTATELGYYLQSTIWKQTKHVQKPLFGKIQHTTLDKGDFIFRLPSADRYDAMPPEQRTNPDNELEKEPLKYGSMRLIANIGGDLFLDEEFIENIEAGNTYTISDIPIGNHILKINGNERWSQNVLVKENIMAEIAAGSKTRVIVEERPEIVTTDPLETIENNTCKDFRDGKVYKTIKIGNTTWMAENLKYQIDGSYCYKNNSQNCNLYGRLYEFEAANRACPDGWDLPDADDWNMLFSHYGNIYKAFDRLTGGTNDDGFDLVFAGHYIDNTGSQGQMAFKGLNNDAQFWSSSVCENFNYTRIDVRISKSQRGIFLTDCSKYNDPDVRKRAETYRRSSGARQTKAYSVRCVKND